MKMVSEHKGLTEDVVIFACRVIRSMHYEKAPPAKGRGRMWHRLRSAVLYRHLPDAGQCPARLQPTHLAETTSGSHDRR